MRTKAHWRKGSRTDYHILFAQKCDSHRAIVTSGIHGLVDLERHAQSCSRCTVHQGLMSICSAHPSLSHSPAVSCSEGPEFTAVTCWRKTEKRIKALAVTEGPTWAQVLINKIPGKAQQTPRKHPASRAAEEGIFLSCEVPVNLTLPGSWLTCEKEKNQPGSQGKNPEM